MYSKCLPSACIHALSHAHHLSTDVSMTHCSVLCQTLSQKIEMMLSDISSTQNKKPQLTQGLRATAVLGFLKFESCTISSAVPENPT